MSNSSITPNVYLPGTTSANMTLLSLRKRSAQNVSSSWRKFIPKPSQQQKKKFVLMVIPVERTTTKGPIMLKASLPEGYNAAQIQRHRKLTELMQSWHEDDELEDPQSWELLKQALDEDRLSDRKLFP